VLLEDLRTHLTTWRQNGERLLVFIDANEDSTNGPFHALFTGPDLHMREAISHRHPDPRWPHTATYAKGDSLGKWPIDGAYVTPDIPVDAATWLQFIPSLGDHRFCVLDVNAQVLVGEDVLKIVCPQARRLACTIPSAVSAYTKQLTQHLQRHKVLNKLHHLYMTRDGSFTPAQ
jgi:hypothetical protein